MVTLTKKQKEQRERALRLKKASKSLKDMYAKEYKRKAEIEKAVSGAEKQGGFLGFGGEYAPNVDAQGNKIAGMTKGQKMAAAGLAIDAAKSSGLIDTSSTGGGALAGGASGAMMGAQVGGVPGAVIGGAVGALTGGLKARAARKKAQAEAEADVQEGLAKISQDKAERLKQSFSSLGSAMSAGLRQTNFVSF